MIAFVVAVLTSSFIVWGIFIVIVGILVVSIACSVTCPKCKNRLNPREVAEGVKRERLYYDCPTCQISWRSEVINQDD